MLAKYLADLSGSTNPYEAIDFLLQNDYIIAKLPPPRQEVVQLKVLTYECPCQFIGKLKNKNIIYIRYRDFKLSVGYSRPTESLDALTTQNTSLHKDLKGILEDQNSITIDELRQHCEMFIFPDDLPTVDGAMGRGVF